MYFPSPEGLIWDEGHQPLRDEKKAKYEVKSITANFSTKALLIW